MIRCRDGKRVLSVASGGAYFVWSFLGDATPVRYEFPGRPHMSAHATRGGCEGDGGSTGAEFEGFSDGDRLPFADGTIPITLPAVGAPSAVSSIGTGSSDAGGGGEGEGDVDGTRWASAIRSVGAGNASADPSLANVRDALSVSSSISGQHEFSSALRHSRARAQLVSSDEQRVIQSEIIRTTTPPSDTWGGSASVDADVTATGSAVPTPDVISEAELSGDSDNDGGEVEGNAGSQRDEDGADDAMQSGNGASRRCFCDSC